MSYIVDFNTVSTIGLASSPVAAALAGLRANEARYLMNKFKHAFTVEPADESQATIDYISTILKKERDIVFTAKPLETSRFQAENIRFAYVYYEDGLGVNVMYAVDDPKKRAVGFKLSEGMAVPKALEGKFKFASQKSTLAGTIRGSFFVIKGEY
ncbi:phage tail protein [Oscillospiraceae bacterium CM]|nr:phage tail protein [Oscillospiraceae bacterium CM]